MQLPRGKFRSVIKGVALNSLMQELAEVRYTGTISISWKKEAITLVIQRGRYVLAEYGSLRGDRAWEGILALGETTIDAFLSDFSEPELKLALEFNEPCALSSQAVLRPPRSAREREREPPPRREVPARAAEAIPRAEPVKPPAQPAPTGGYGSPPPPKKEAGPKEVPPKRDAAPGEVPPRKEGEAGESSAGREVAGAPPQAWTKVDMSQAIAMTTEEAGEEIPSLDGYDELALLHMEMSALDDVDVEHIATKIRKNARGIVKKLHLGHLMTEKEE